MAKPKCPSCGGTNVVPSLAKNSHNNCVGCGCSDFVVAFYETKLQGTTPGEANVVPTEDHPTRKPYWWED